MRALLFCFFAFFICTCKAHTVEQSPEQILNFWFGELSSFEDYPEEKSKIWFSKNVQLDHEIQCMFETLLLNVDELINWRMTAKKRLALIILTDQFSRNMYRNTPKAFAFDAFALKMTLEGIEQGHDLELLPIERVFFYLPLEHAEDLKIQQLSVTKFEQLAIEAPPSLRKKLDSYADYARKHYEIIARFGRFPHRNTILNRISTEEELLFLEGPNSSF